MFLFSYFIGFALLGSIAFQIPLLYASGTPVPYIDGLFTTVSALCVTGLSTVDMSVYTNAGFAVILFLIEAGGLGLIAFFMFYLALPARKISLVNRRFVRDYFILDVESNPRKIVARIIIYTFAIQLTGAVILFLLLRQYGEQHAFFYSLFLSVSAFCNAGFAPYPDSMHRFNGNYTICLTVAVLIISGGLGFTVIEDVFATAVSRLPGRKKRHLSFYSRIVFAMTLLLIIIPAVIFFFTDSNYAFKGFSVSKKICNALFQSITTRTAGFDTVSQNSFSPLASFISTLLMFIGGSPGSMAGGIKTTTVFLLLCYAFRSEDDQNMVTVFRRDIPDASISKAVGIIIKALIFLSIVVCFLCLTEHENFASGKILFDQLVYEIVSAFGTVGLSKGVTGLLTTAGKSIIIITMFFGRTGVMAMSLTVHSVSSDLKKVVDRPQESVLVG